MDHKPPPDVTPRALDWHGEIEVAVRDALACRRCETPLLDDQDRRFVLIAPAAGDTQENVALVCCRCRCDHADHPRPLPGPDERNEIVN